MKKTMLLTLCFALIFAMSALSETDISQIRQSVIGYENAVEDPYIVGLWKFDRDETEKVAAEMYKNGELSYDDMQSLTQSINKMIDVHGYTTYQYFTDYGDHFVIYRSLDLSYINLRYLSGYTTSYGILYHVGNNDFVPYEYGKDNNTLLIPNDGRKPNVKYAFARCENDEIGQYFGVDIDEGIIGLWVYDAEASQNLNKDTFDMLLSNGWLDEDEIMWKTRDIAELNGIWLDITEYGIVNSIEMDYYGEFDGDYIEVLGLRFGGIKEQGDDYEFTYETGLYVASNGILFVQDYVGTDFAGLLDDAIYNGEADFSKSSDFWKYELTDNNSTLVLHYENEYHVTYDIGLVFRRAY